MRGKGEGWGGWRGAGGTGEREILFLIYGGGGGVISKRKSAKRRGRREDLVVQHQGLRLDLERD